MGQEQMRNKVILAGLSLSLVSLLSGCSKASPDKSSSTTGKTETAKTESGKTMPPDTTSGTAQTPDSKTAQTNAAGSQTTPQPQAEQSVDKTAAVPDNDLNKPKINLDRLPGSTVICTVSGDPITVAEYQRMFKLQQIQMQNVVTSDANARQRMLEQAQKTGLTLTADETSRLLAAARQNKDPNSEEFKKFLREKNITNADFEKQIKEIGLAIKMSNNILQQSLLNDLVNRELLVSAAKGAGLNSTAMNRYLQIKHTDSYNQLLQATGFSPDDLKDELMKTELTKLMIEKIQKRNPVTDAEIKTFYNQHSELFKHKERVRISQILVGAPSQDSQQVQSVKTQLQKANSKLTGKELDSAVALTIERQRQRAMLVLAQAKAAGVNFASLANQYTDDVAAKSSKSGGDLGWQERAQLIPQFADAMWPLKPGEVYPKLVQTPLGFHIVKVTAHEKAGPISLAEAKNLIRPSLMQQKGDQALSEWIQGHRITSEVVLSPKFQSLANKASGSNATSSLAPPTH